MNSRLFLPLICLLLMVGGCQDANRAANLPNPEPTWSGSEQATAGEVYVAPRRQGQSFSVVQTDSQTREGYTVDAMIGQINGRPLYASEVFKSIGEDALRTIATSKPRAEFLRDIAMVLQATLGQRVTDALVLAEAEASLSEREQYGLLEMLKQYREDLVSKAGGSPGAASAMVWREKGISLDQAVEEQRQRILVSKYLQEKLYPRIHITRYDVERFYEENHSEFNPKPNVKLKLMRVQSATDADAVEQALAAGTPFEDVIQMRGVRISDIEHAGAIQAFRSLAWEEVNQRVQQLTEGQITERLAVPQVGSLWVQVEEVVTGESKPLPEVYLSIERRLRAQRFDQLNRQYMADLLDRGNYTPIEKMMDVLMEVAINRYALGE